MTWSKLLALVFKIDVMQCPKCQTRLNPELWQQVTTQPLIAQMLMALNINPRHPPILPAVKNRGNDDDDDEYRQTENDD